MNYHTIILDYRSNLVLWCGNTATKLTRKADKDRLALTFGLLSKAGWRGVHCDGRVVFKQVPAIAKAEAA